MDYCKVGLMDYCSISLMDYCNISLMVHCSLSLTEYCNTSRMDYHNIGLLDYSMSINKYIMHNITYDMYARYVHTRAGKHAIQVVCNMRVRCVYIFCL